MSSNPLEPGPVRTETAPLLAPGAELAPPSPALAQPARFPLRARVESLRTERALQRLLTALKVGAVLLVVYGLVFNFSVVRGSSMSPGIHDGDRILVNHLTYLLQSVQRGDIVVLRYPLDPSLDYIKRVIGLPGDLVRIHGGFVSVNGEVLEEPYIAQQDRRGDMAVRVEPEHYFVMGDNRPHSSDSREFGQVPRENLVGKVDLCIWPPTRVGVLE
jgi:signal peptidase I